MKGVDILNFTEEYLEEAAIEILQELGYTYVFGPDISCDGEYPERKDYREVILEERVRMPYLESIEIYQGKH